MKNYNDLSPISLLLAVMLMFFSCDNKSENYEIKLSEANLAVLDEVLKTIVKREFDSEKLDTSYLVCKQFGYFSSSRFPPSIESRLAFLNPIEKEINKKFFRNSCNQLTQLSVEERGTSFFSFSGFNEDYVIVTYTDLGSDEIINLDDACVEVANSFSMYLVSIKNNKVEILERSSAHLN